MKLLLNLKMCLAFMHSENRHTSQKYTTSFSRVLDKNVTQLTHNYS